MTHIIKDKFPKEPFKLLRLPININDRLIFQTDSEPETEVIITDVKDQPGLMKGWKVVSWKEN